MNQDNTTQEILEIVQFIKDNAASKADLDGFATKEDLQRFATKEDLATSITAAKTEIMSHVDGFIVLHQQLETELTALRSKYNRLEQHVQQLARHLQLSLQ